MSSVPITDIRLCQLLSEDLAAANFYAETLRTLWGTEADDAWGRGVREPILRELRRRLAGAATSKESADLRMAGPDEVLATLGLFFVLGLVQPESTINRALPGLGAAGLVALGLAQRSADALIPLCLLRPQSYQDALGQGNFWIASDFDEAVLGTTLEVDHVLGVGSAATTLAQFVVRTPVGRALDLGTGCGIQALLLSRHCRSVIATDISHRALAYAAFNAALNGVANIELVYGNLLEPVAGEQFDLIVSNPPFVITPRKKDIPEYEYRDGGMVGDALVEQLLRQFPGFLTPGGIAQILGNWEYRGSDSGLERVTSWIADGCSGWVVERDRTTATAYAELWIRDGGTTPRDAKFGDYLSAWLDDFDSRDVGEIGFGAVTMQRSGERGGVVLRRAERITHPISNPGAALAQGLEAAQMSGYGGMGSLPEFLRYPADVTEARHFIPGDGDPMVIELRQGGGFSRTVGVDSALAAFVGACDGELSVSQIFHALADIYQLPEADLRAGLEPAIWDLLVDGFLITAKME